MFSRIDQSTIYWPIGEEELVIVFSLSGQIAMLTIIVYTITEYWWTLYNSTIYSYDIIRLITLLPLAVFLLIHSMSFSNGTLLYSPLMLICFPMLAYPCTAIAAIRTSAKILCCFKSGISWPKNYKKNNEETQSEQWRISCDGGISRDSPAERRPSCTQDRVEE